MTLSSNFNYLQSADYTYNIRGWLTGINDVANCNIQSGDQLADMFKLQLSYDAPVGGGTAQYNGNIATMQWRTYVNSTCLAQQQYRFGYDAANRLTAADHYTNSSGSWAFTNNYTESNIAYDLNGNIKSYTRRGLTSGTSTFGNIDQLTYYFEDAARPDRLTRVVDAASATKGFKYLVSATSPLPKEVQFSCVKAIHLADLNGDGKNDLVLGGNDAGFMPQFSKLDASFGHVLLNRGGGQFERVENRESGFFIRGDVKQIFEIKKGAERWLVVLVNNEKPRLYKLANTQTRQQSRGLGTD